MRTNTPDEVVRHSEFCETLKNFLAQNDLDFSTRQDKVVARPDAVRVPFFLAGDVEGGWLLRSALNGFTKTDPGKEKANHIQTNTAPTDFASGPGDGPWRRNSKRK